MGDKKVVFADLVADLKRKDGKPADVADLSSKNFVAYAYYTLPFKVHMDASLNGLGAVLYQTQAGIERSKAYASQGLKPSEKNYPAHKLEFLALKWYVTGKFHDFLYGSSFEIITDNYPLTYILPTAKLDATGQRWVASPSDFNFTIKYRSGLYFSAHWCPPCRGFTPKLVEFYNGWQAAKNDKTLEIIFVSSDGNDKEFDEYYKEMPWVALKHGSGKKDDLSNMFGIRGIPTLVILDGSGELVTMDGRGQVMSGKYDFTS